MWGLSFILGKGWSCNQNIVFVNIYMGGRDGRAYNMKGFYLGFYSIIIIIIIIIIITFL